MSVIVAPVGKVTVYDWVWMGFVILAEISMYVGVGVGNPAWAPAYSE